MGEISGLLLFSSLSGSATVTAPLSPLKETSDHWMAPWGRHTFSCSFCARPNVVQPQLTAPPGAKQKYYHYSYTSPSVQLTLSWLVLSFLSWFFHSFWVARYAHTHTPTATPLPPPHPTPPPGGNHCLICWQTCVDTFKYFKSKTRKVQVQFSLSVVSDSLGPHGLQHTRLPCPSQTPRAYSYSCALSWWCHPTISSSIVPFSSCLQSSASVLPMNIQDWFPLRFPGWISLQSKGLSRVFSNTTVQKNQFFSTQLSL